MPGWECLSHPVGDLMNQGEWCQGRGSNPHEAKPRGNLRLKKNGNEISKSSYQLVALSCFRGLRGATVFYEGYGHPDGHLFGSRER